jgi:arylsulfatase A-like enzyme
MQRRTLFAAIAGCCLSVSAALAAAWIPQPASARPNVILVMTDDQGYGDLSCHGNPTLKTPNLDRLHAESVRFTDFHVAPFCTPTRASLMTGRYAARTGAYRTSSGRTSLHPREKTLGDLFTHNGYATGMFGKWHIGDCAPSRPMDKGFQHAVWHRCGGVTQISDYWTNDYFDDTYLIGDRWTKFEGYCTDVWFDEAMKFMESVVADGEPHRPFFVYLPTNAPHGPYLVGEKWRKPFLELGMDKKTASFKGMVANFDWNLGRLMQFLEKHEFVDNTILVFLTDNGTAAGAIFGNGGRITGWPKDPRENGHMRGGKSSAYDGGHRVPLFIRWPGGDLGQPRDIDTLAAHIDMTPTLMDLCGLERPEAWPRLDGRSLTGLLRHRDEPWEPRTLHTQMHGGNGYVKPGDPWEVGAVMTERWRLVEGNELYDITADPMQRRDVAAEHPDIVARMRKEHLAWFDSLRPGMTPTRIVVGSDFENPTDLTSQEWVMPRGGPPWSHGHVVNRTISNGPWWLDVARAGKYRISLSRWPRYIKEPIDSTAAGIELGGQTLEMAIDKPGETVTADFEVTLDAGPTELITKLTTPGGKTHGAYFATIERIASN